MPFKIRYGIKGFVDVCEWENCAAETFEEAEDMAYEAACNKYDDLDGKHGLKTIAQIAEEHPDWPLEQADTEWFNRREKLLLTAVKEI